MYSRPQVNQYNEQLLLKSSLLKSRHLILKYGPLISGKLILSRWVSVQDGYSSILLFMVVYTKKS